MSGCCSVQFQILKSDRPITGEIMATMIASGKATEMIDMNPFDRSRFRGIQLFATWSFVCVVIMNSSDSFLFKWRETKWDSRLYVRGQCYCFVNAKFGCCAFVFTQMKISIQLFHICIDSNVQLWRYWFCFARNSELLTSVETGKLFLAISNIDQSTNSFECALGG